MNKNEAEKNKLNLTGADLRGADLRGADLNCIFYKTKITKEQKKQIINSDLFEVVNLMMKNELYNR